MKRGPEQPPPRPTTATHPPKPTDPPRPTDPPKPPTAQPVHRSPTHTAAHLQQQQPCQTTASQTTASLATASLATAGPATAGPASPPPLAPPPPASPVPPPLAPPPLTPPPPAPPLPTPSPPREQGARWGSGHGCALAAGACGADVRWFGGEEGQRLGAARGGCDPQFTGPGSGRPGPRPRRLGTAVPLRSGGRRQGSRRRWTTVPAGPGSGKRVR